MGGFLTMIPLLDWIPQKTLVLALGVSAGITAGSVILAPIIIAQLPADYFQEQPRRPREESRRAHPLLHYTVASIKNLLGAALIVVGAVMVPFPGQGLLTMIVGLGIVDLPGKHRLVTAIVRRPAVLRSLNWIRAKSHKSAFLAPAAA